MKIQHLRNATSILTLGGKRFVVDPMLADVGVMPGFKMLGGGRRNNPLVPLPVGTQEALETVDAVIVTHQHPDHFDQAAVRWIKQRNLPVWANTIDAPTLKRKGLDVHELQNGALGMTIEVIPSRHGQGLVGWLMGPVAGYYFAHPGEPSLYMTGDSVLTENVLDAVARLKPDVILAPAGAANMGFGGDILFSVDELVRLIQQADGQVILNHLEALDHCPTTRVALRKRMQAEGLQQRVFIPNDGDELEFTDPPHVGRENGELFDPTKSGGHKLNFLSSRPQVNPSNVARPGLQKWVTQWFAGT